MTMEPDSTTLDNILTTLHKEKCFPFHVAAENLITYKSLVAEFGLKSFDRHIVLKLQDFHLLPRSVKCISLQPNCNMVVKAARVVDKVQWVCEGCGKRQPIRSGSFFLRIPCSLLQTLQIILAWCEDADLDVAAQYFDVKPKVASFVYDKLDELAVSEQSRYKLGGDNSVVLTEMYPDCLNRLSPDTTEQPHVHRILMMADTNHIPTSYKFHVITGDTEKTSNLDYQNLKSELETVLSNATLTNSLVVTGNNVPPIDGATSLQQLLQSCDSEMRHFLSRQVWRQAVNLCAASRDLCRAAAACDVITQRYLHAAAFRRRLPHDFYRHVLTALAAHYTQG